MMQKCQNWVPLFVINYFDGYWISFFHNINYLILSISVVSNAETV